MTSAPITNRFTALSNDDLFYHYYAYDGLDYIIDINKKLYETYKKQGEGQDPLFDKKCSILKFQIIVHFCHYAEDLGAFLYPCHEVNPSLNSADILETFQNINYAKSMNFIRVSMINMH
jgi:hypothetical protein